MSKEINLQRDLTLQADEKRYPRDRFTKQLVRICNTLDDVSVRDISYAVYGTTATCHLEATELWVVGSYARGALICGDLDIVVNFAATGAGLPLAKILFRAFFGATPGIRFYSGTPEVNKSGVVFPDAVMIWSSQDCDWQARIDSIKPDSGAGRSARDTDSVPLRAEQMRFPSCTLNDVARWERDGILEWDFVSLDNELLSAMPPQEIGSKERQLFECITGMGQKTLDLIPAVWRLMRETEPGASWKAAVSEKATLRCGGTLIHVGVPALDLTHFENAKVRQLMLVPHRTARGPNGMWLIRRGPRHPHMLGLKRCCIFYIGKPGAEAAAYPQREGGDAGVIEVFDLKADATEALKKMKLNSANSSQVIQAKGFALYELIIQADAIRYGDDLISFTSNRPSASVKK